MTEERLYTKSELESIDSIKHIGYYYEIDQKDDNKYSLSLKIEMRGEYYPFGLKVLESKLRNLDSNKSQ